MIDKKKSEFKAENQKTTDRKDEFWIKTYKNQVCNVYRIVMPFSDCSINLFLLEIHVQKLINKKNSICIIH
jgi:hypothetical protein